MSCNGVNSQQSTVNGTNPGCGIRRVRRVLVTVDCSLLTLLLLTACRATTTRPSITPLPSATTAEVELSIPAATRALAERLAEDSVSLRTIRELDGYIDSGWLDAGTLERTSKRPPGGDVVRVRAWINPAKESWSELVVEATFRPWIDPSRPERELDVALPAEHPLQRRIAGSLRKLIEAHGDAAALKALAQPPKPAPVKPDTTKVRPDTAKRT